MLFLRMFNQLQNCESIERRNSRLIRQNGLDIDKSQLSFEVITFIHFFHYPFCFFIILLIHFIILLIYSIILLISFIILLIPSIFLLFPSIFLLFPLIILLIPSILILIIQRRIQGGAASPLHPPDRFRWVRSAPLRF